MGKEAPSNKKRKALKKRKNSVTVLRGCLTVFAELAGIAGFLLALYIFLRGL
jgi:hypothetical protein